MSIKHPIGITASTTHSTPMKTTLSIIINFWRVNRSLINTVYHFIFCAIWISSSSWTKAIIHCYLNEMSWFHYWTSKAEPLLSCRNQRLQVRLAERTTCTQWCLRFGRLVCGGVRIASRWIRTQWRSRSSNPRSYLWQGVDPRAIKKMIKFLQPDAREILESVVAQSIHSH